MESIANNDSQKIRNYANIFCLKNNCVQIDDTLTQLSVNDFKYIFVKLVPDKGFKKEKKNKGIDSLLLLQDKIV